MMCMQMDGRNNVHVHENDVHANGKDAEMLMRVKPFT